MPDQCITFEAISQFTLQVNVDHTGAKLEWGVGASPSTWNTLITSATAGTNYPITVNAATVVTIRASLAGWNTWTNTYTVNANATIPIVLVGRPVIDIQSVASNGTFVVGTVVVNTVVIKNTGTASTVVSAELFDFTITPYSGSPTTAHYTVTPAIAPGGTATVTINYTPLVSGTHQCCATSLIPS